MSAPVRSRWDYIGQELTTLIIGSIAAAYQTATSLASTCMHHVTYQWHDVNTDACAPHPCHALAADSLPDACEPVCTVTCTGTHRDTCIGTPSPTAGSCMLCTTKCIELEVLCALATQRHMHLSVPPLISYLHIEVNLHQRPCSLDGNLQVTRRSGVVMISWLLEPATIGAGMSMCWKLIVE